MNLTKFICLCWKIVYFILITPIGFLLRTAKIQQLDVGYADSDSYWRNRRVINDDPRKNFRNIG